MPPTLSVNLLLLIIAILLPVQGCAPSPPAEHPSVIIVDIDTLRGDHLGCYGYERPTSPHIDTFCRESVQFEWAFSQAPNTPPSQASILTGLYPTAHGRIGDDQVLPESTTLLAEVFRDAGYQTGAFVDGGLMAGEFGLNQGFDVYDDEGGGLEKIDGKARNWLRTHGAEPFLLLIHSYDVHSPYERTPEPFKSSFLPGLERPSEEFIAHMTQRMEERRLSRYGENPFSLNDVEVEYARALYDGGILHMDDWFGSFMKFLVEQGLYESTIIVFISDHGDAFEEHDSVFHERIYSPVTRVPLLIRFPGGELAQKISQAVETVDLMPTLLEAVHLPLPGDLHGQALGGLMRGDTDGYREVAISESPFFGRRIAVATSEFRLIYTVRGERAELYRYRVDPWEQDDLSSRETVAAERLTESVHKWEGAMESQKRVAAKVDQMRDSTLEQLRTLGYISD